LTHLFTWNEYLETPGEKGRRRNSVISQEPGFVVENRIGIPIIGVEGRYPGVSQVRENGPGSRGTRGGFVLDNYQSKHVSGRIPGNNLAPDGQGSWLNFGPDKFGSAGSSDYTLEGVGRGDEGELGIAGHLAIEEFCFDFLVHLLFDDSTDAFVGHGAATDGAFAVRFFVWHGGGILGEIYFEN